MPLVALKDAITPITPADVGMKTAAQVRCGSIAKPLGSPQLDSSRRGVVVACADNDTGGHCWFCEGLLGRRGTPCSCAGRWIYFWGGRALGQSPLALLETYEGARLS